MSIITSAASLLNRSSSKVLVRPSSRKLRQAVALCTHLSGCLAVTKILLGSGLRCILRHNPRTPFKFVGNYVSLSLSCRNRLGILLHHYRFIDTCFNRTFIASILQEPLTLWQTDRGDDTYTVSITLSEFDLEGDLSLILKRNMQRVCVLSFTIVPGELLELNSGHALFVSRIQGAKNFEMIRTVTKALGEVCPPTVLLTAARGIAMAAGLGSLAGVSSSAQVTVGEEDPAERIRFFNYDEFWHSKGGIRKDNDVFHLTVAPHSKPAEAIKGKHRARTLRKRQFEDEVLEMCRLKFENTCLKPAESPRYPLGKTAVLSFITGMSAFY